MQNISILSARSIKTGLSTSSVASSYATANTSNTIRYHYQKKNMNKSANANESINSTFEKMSRTFEELILNEEMHKKETEILKE